MESKFQLPENIIIEYNRPEEAFIRLKDGKKPWPDNNCSDQCLLQYLNREGETIKRVKFTDEQCIGDGLLIYF